MKISPIITTPGADREIEQALADMETNLREIYGRANEEIRKKSVKFFEQTAKEEAAMKVKVDAGKITEAQFKEWKKRKLLQGKEYQQMERRVLTELTNVNKTALAYINGELPELYVINYNATGTALVNTANRAFRLGISFELVDRDTVRLLATVEQDLLPYKKLDIPKDRLWNKKKLQSEILQGVIQGESVDKIAKRLQNVTDMNRNSAIRNARTMTAAARSRGHVEAMKRSEKMGIVAEKEWMATSGSRTRPEHQKLNGQTAKVDEPFKVDGYEIMYPGDTTAAPEMVYNCRCRLVERLIGVIDPDTGFLKKFNLKE